VVKMLERWVSVFNYCLFLQISIKSKSISDYRIIHFKGIISLFIYYDYYNKLEFADIDIVEKILENRDANNLGKFVHDKFGVMSKYQNFADPKCLKNKIRFNYLDDWKNHSEFQESPYF
jgi:hypothetical protein